MTPWSCLQRRGVKGHVCGKYLVGHILIPLIMSRKQMHPQIPVVNTKLQLTVVGFFYDEPPLGKMGGHFLSPGTFHVSFYQMCYFLSRGKFPHPRWCGYTIKVTICFQMTPVLIRMQLHLDKSKEKNWPGCLKWIRGSLGVKYHDLFCPNSSWCFWDVFKGFMKNRSNVTSVV